MVNSFIRRQAKAAGVPLWRIAQYLGVSEPTMTRWLRVELNDGDKQRIMSAISELSTGEAIDDAPHN